ncbi:hypothetical protein [Microvirga massiliensis]|uniref:hypothetical protein n=1 Tax=Microvirga massiliensis TaxID=1033741 RepID=UPI0006612A47|nr:hypothetical protein [Microvirga massiliensis]
MPTGCLLHGMPHSQQNRSTGAMGQTRPQAGLRDWEVGQPEIDATRGSNRAKGLALAKIQASREVRAPHALPSPNESSPADNQRAAS